MSDSAAVIIDIIVFAAFGFVHSYLASLDFKRKVAAKIGNYMAFYRLAYNLFFLFTAWIIYEYIPRPDVQIIDFKPPGDIVILTFQIISLIGILWCIKYINVKEFIGISQIIRWRIGHYKTDELDEHLTLRFKGPYKYMRHPLYTFFILFILLRPSYDLFYLIFLIAAISYFYIGALYEEKKMEEIFKGEYRKYKEQVPAFIPYKFYSSNKERE